MRFYEKLFRIGRSPFVGATWFNGVSNVLRTIRVQLWDQDYGDIDRVNPNGEDWVIYVPGQASRFLRWGVTRASDSSVTVNPGAWTRRGTLVAQATSTTVGSISEAGWIVAQLASSTETAELVPASVSASFTTTAPPAGDSTNGIVYLAKVNYAAGAITTVQQLWTGGDIDDTQEIPDGSSSTSAGKRRTLEWNGDSSGKHKGELQIYDVDSVPSNDVALPFYVEASRVIVWHAPDSMDSSAAPGYLSLGFTTGGNFELYNFETGEDSGTLLWGQENGQNDRIVMRMYGGDANGAEVKYATVETLGDAIAEYFGLTENEGGGYGGAIVNLDHGALAGLTDHDHGQYWTNGTGTNGEASIPAGEGGVPPAVDSPCDYTQNYGESIGDSAAALTVDLDEHVLYGGMWEVYGKAEDGEDDSFHAFLGGSEYAGKFTSDGDASAVVTLHDSASSPMHLATFVWPDASNGERKVWICNEDAEAANAYALQAVAHAWTVELCGDYAVDVQSGDANVSDSGYYRHGGHQGETVATSLVLTDSVGGTHTVYLRGGILCVD